MHGPIVNHYFTRFRWDSGDRFRDPIRTFCNSHYWYIFIEVGFGVGTCEFKTSPVFLFSRLINCIYDRNLVALRDMYEHKCDFR